MAAALGLDGSAATVMFPHWGFWRAAYDRTHIGPLAAALGEAGFLVCAPEYRHRGGRGWLPGVLGGPPAEAGRRWAATRPTATWAYWPRPGTGCTSGRPALVTLVITGAKVTSHRL